MTGPMYRRSAELMEADIGDELVALDPHSGNCFGFNGVATTIWRNLAEPKSFGQLRDALLSDYDVSAEQCSAELQNVLDDLIEKGLLAREPAVT